MGGFLFINFRGFKVDYFFKTQCGNKKFIETDYPQDKAQKYYVCFISVSSIHRLLTSW